MSESVTLDKDKLEESSGRVLYSVEKMSECSHPECDSRRNYGVKVTKVRTKKIFDAIPVGENRQTKIFCPSHRESLPESKEAINKEHEMAKNRWQREKRNRRKEEYDKIVESELIPTLSYRRGRLEMEDNSLRATGFESFEEAIEFVLDSRISIPVLVYDRGERYAVANPASEEVDERVITGSDEIEFEKFRNRFSDVSFVDRTFYGIRTNTLTGMDSDRTVFRIEREIDSVVEWKEYSEKQGYIEPGRCQLCDSKWGSYHYSRIIRENEEVIAVSHTGCDKVIGEINPRLVDKDSYDIVDDQIER